MPPQAVNTSHPSYTQLVTQWQSVKTNLRPFLRQYIELSPEKRVQARAAIPLLDDFLTTAERVLGEIREPE